MSIRVTYYYSACVGIQTPDTRVLCDPWFTPGAYDGAWYQYPVLEAPIDRIGRVDLVYISHIHPDHYDAQFLRSYLKRYPSTRLVIPRFRFDYLLNKMRADGLAPEALETVRVGETQLDLLPNENEQEPDPNDVDSALVVRWRSHSVVNMNDNAFNPQHIARIRALCSVPDIALLGYTGAGPYPQTYSDDAAELERLAEEKKQRFFSQYRQMRAALGPRVVIPFAGKYLLGGKLAALNDYRGVADAVEVAQFDPSAVVLDDGGDASIDTETLLPTRVRHKPYAAEKVAQYVASLRELPLHYEGWMTQDAAAALPIERLLRKAYAGALGRSRCQENYWFCIRLAESWALMNVNPGNPQFEVRSDTGGVTPRSELEVDLRQLFGLLTGVYHWNNAEVGSHLRVRRHPDTFNRAAQRFLNFLHV